MRPRNLSTLAAVGYAFALLACCNSYCDTLISATTLSYVGAASQSYTVPTGTTYVVVKAWGGGGAGYYGAYNGWHYFCPGGDGALASAQFDVKVGDVFTVSVAGGGGAGTGGWPGGGSG